MVRVLLLCVFLSLQNLQCLSRGGPYRSRGANSRNISLVDYEKKVGQQDPSVGEYFLEAVDLANRTRWRYFLPEDTDIDQDGNLSDLEVQHKFNTYMGEVFKLIDHDKDNSITEEEFRSLKLDIPHLTKVVDIALENFPLKPFFLAADANGDGVYDENDFYMPEKKERFDSRRKTPETIVNINQYDNNKVSKGSGVGVAKIGQNEGTVICKSLGYDGLERVVEAAEFDSLDRSVTAYSCDGTEAVLEDCQRVGLSFNNPERGMGVVCQGGDKLGALHLVGGKDASSGDILFGKKGLVCHPYYHRHANSEVICRELGYSGLLTYTTESAFTGISFGENQRIGQQFYCDGTEERLADCRVQNENCHDVSLYGVICATDGKTGVNRALSDLIKWPRNGARIWENAGRFLFIADANGDGKLTLEELATKGKELMTKILEFLDENQDGKISLEDLNLHLSVGPIQNLVSELFDDVTAGQGEFDLYNIKIAGQDMSKFVTFTGWDYNLDGKLNAADFFSRGESMEKALFLIPMASKKIDKNQDGKIQREELRQIIDYMFNQLDMDKNGALTLEDLYSLMRENGLDCFQVGAFRSFVDVFLDRIDTQTRDVLSYIFHQFDMDRNGQISPTELEQMHVPCDMSGRYRYRGYDYNSNDDSDPNAKKRCGFMFDGFKIGALIRSFPDSIFSERHGRGGYRIKRWGGDGHGGRRGGRDDPRKETLVDKLTNHACEILT